ncbi:recombinase family protein [Halomonas borealis]|uniref:recombinase family protein n=1 Tax=Halomonas borealis TaxID=2508710 RepID=UPI00109FC871|nr:recombinase family protein [Halomonas borealis]
MGRTFAYCRIGAVESALDAQVGIIEAAGYSIEPYRVVSEAVQGALPAMQRPAFRSMVEHKLEPGDTLVVLTLDRLGGDNIDLRRSIAHLAEGGIRVVSLDVPMHDLTSHEGQGIFRVFEAFAEFERKRIGERTREGLERARRRGSKLGRPVATDTTDRVQRLKAQGVSQSQAAARSGLSIATIKRHWNKRPVGAE